ncbi:DNA-binding response regulator [Fulvitalea axinellae]|uniref:DNA-binding response regulator n=1 Tax=Fulvitalea axinellae TaxID=1182444 RepID=A0AAU9CAZ0_9BACT|nr:DNA-binding response regulator [Fulvitalea axinellae]
MLKGKKPKVLLVEDDEDLAFLVADNLQIEGFDVIRKADGEQAWEELRTNEFDICVFDVMLPKLDGFGLAERLRNTNTEVPIIFLTAKSIQEDRLKGLRLGADDYITKPFDMEELILRMRVFLKRSGSSNSGKDKFKLGNLTFLPLDRVLELGEEQMKLTGKECEVLKILSKKMGKVVSRTEILEGVWGRDDYFLGRSLDVHLSKLRKHLKADPSVLIENVHGLGFRLKAGE